MRVAVDLELYVTVGYDLDHKITIDFHLDSDVAVDFEFERSHMRTTCCASASAPPAYKDFL